MSDASERRALEEEHRRERERREFESIAMFAGPSIVKPLQHKIWRAEGSGIWAAYEFEGRPCNIKMADAISPVIAMMIASGMNARQEQLAKQEAAL